VDSIYASRQGLSNRIAPREPAAKAADLCAVATTDSTQVEERRAFRRALRNVARLLRWSGLALVVLGTAGFVTSEPGDWWVGPSWVSFILGWALMLAGVVRRMRDRRRSDLPEG
jgi:protein-S-isoprenylcysteine O-methyltransferase Ste14